MSVMHLKMKEGKTERLLEQFTKATVPAATGNYGKWSNKLQNKKIYNLKDAEETYE